MAHTRLPTSPTWFCFFIRPMPLRKGLNSVEFKSSIYGPSPFSLRAMWDTTIHPLGAQRPCWHTFDRRLGLYTFCNDLTLHPILLDSRLQWRMHGFPLACFGLLLYWTTPSRQCLNSIEFKSIYGPSPFTVQELPQYY